jgi:hypothetical protein
MEQIHQLRVEVVVELIPDVELGSVKKWNAQNATAVRTLVRHRSNPSPGIEDNLENSPCLLTRRSGPITLEVGPATSLYEGAYVPRRILASPLPVAFAREGRCEMLRQYKL